MTAIAINGTERSKAADEPVRTEGRQMARISGILYVILFALGMFSPLVLESFIVDGNATATTDKISGSLGLFGISLVTWSVIVAADIAISVTLYLLLEPVSRSLAMVTMAFRLVYSAVLGAFLLNLFDAFALLNGAERVAELDLSQTQLLALSSIDQFEAGFHLALVFFGIHLIGLGYLLKRSGQVPLLLGITLVIAGVGYVANSMAGFFLANHSDAVATALLVPALLGELGLTVWLLLTGFRRSRSTLPDVG